MVCDMTECNANQFATDRCPICGGDNECGVAAANKHAATHCSDGAKATCWCFDVQIPDAALQRIPKEAVGHTCICRRCSMAQATASGVTTTRDPGGREAIVLEANGQRVLIATTGAQVLSYHVHGKDVLWTASAPEYLPNKPVRGGVPVVFPWFGDHKTDPQLPAHGFARSLTWQTEANGPATVTFTCQDTEQTRAIWNHAFRVALTVSLDEALTLAMVVTNSGDQEFQFEAALHSYFAAGEIHEASVHGLQGVPFVEHAREPEGDWDSNAPIQFRAETDRVFQHVPDELTLRAQTLARTVTLRSNNAGSAIVWNPWPNKTARLSQMRTDDWRSFVCIETANVADHAVTLAPGAQHEMTLRITATDDPAP